MRDERWLRYTMIVADAKRPLMPHASCLMPDTP